MRVRGVACHIGSQILEVEPFLKALDEILKVAQAIRAHRTPIEFLDIGGAWLERLEGIAQDEDLSRYIL